jgi:hypothetical protein
MSRCRVLHAKTGARSASCASTPSHWYAPSALGLFSLVVSAARTLAFDASSVPQFALSVPTLDAIGGPFRAPGAYEAYIVRGSMDAEYFLTLFEVLLRDVRAGQRVYDVRAAPYPRDEWHHQRSGTRVKTFETPVARDASVVCTTGGECNGGECPQ